MANPVIHFEVLGKDAAALQRFYGEAFGYGPTIALFADPEGHVVGLVKAA
jgi:predicted enzyme related to lactoylglutathione lyase